MNSHYTIPKGENAKEYNENVKKTFQEVFTSEKGAAVLNILLNDLHVFEEVKNEDEVSLRNYARFFLLERLGVVDSVAVTDAILSGIVQN